MKIVINTNGSITSCKLYRGNMNGTSFKKADKLSQMLAINAFRVIEKQLK